MEGKNQTKGWERRNEKERDVGNESKIAKERESERGDAMNNLGKGKEGGKETEKEDGGRERGRKSKKGANGGERIRTVGYQG